MNHVDKANTLTKDELINDIVISLTGTLGLPKNTTDIQRGSRPAYRRNDRSPNGPSNITEDSAKYSPETCNIQYRVYKAPCTVYVL